MTDTPRAFVKDSATPLQLKSNLNLATEYAAKITQKYDEVYAEYARLVGEGPIGPTGLRGFETVGHALEYAKKVEKDILELQARIKDVRDNETPQLQELKEIAERLDVKIALNRGGAGGNGYS